MKYIYKGTDTFKYHDSIIANHDDLLEIGDMTIRNLTDNPFLTHKVTNEIIKEIIEKSVEEKENDIDYDLVDDEVDKLFKSELFKNNNKNTIKKLIRLGILKTTKTSCQDYNIGESNYSKHSIQPWHIWQEYDLNPWDADIVKRILRTKSVKGMADIQSRIMDYEKIIHICNERIRQLK